MEDDSTMADYYKDQQIGNEFNIAKKLKSKLHKCKDGRIVDIRGVSDKYPRMDDEHLLNCIKYIKSRAKEGVEIAIGGGSNIEDFWYDTDILFGKEARDHLNYKVYKKEAKRRGLI